MIGVSKTFGGGSIPSSPVEEEPESVENNVFRFFVYTTSGAKKRQEGFCIRPNKFYIIPVIRIRKPRLLNITYWDGGFFTYTYKKESLLDKLDNKR